MTLQLAQHPEFRTWLGRLPKPVALSVAEGVRYLLEHGRQADLPDVRHHIQTSRHYPDMSEVRVDMVVDGKPHVLRTLTCFLHKDTVLLVCIAGNKDGYLKRTGRDWYDDYVPVADEVVDWFLQEHEGK